MPAGIFDYGTEVATKSYVSEQTRAVEARISLLMQELLAQKCRIEEFKQKLDITEYKKLKDAYYELLALSYKLEEKLRNPPEILDTWVVVTRTNAYMRGYWTKEAAEKSLTEYEKKYEYRVAHLVEVRD